MGILSEQSVSQVHGIHFLLHHHVGIDFRGVNAGMPKKFARRVDVCPGCHGHGGKGVAAGVEGDKFVDSGTFRHGLQSPVGSTQFRSVGENQLVACIFRSLRHPRLCLLPQRNDDGMLGLLHGRHKYHLAFVSLANVLPSECCHVTMSQPCETAEHESLLGAKCNNIQVDGMSFIEKLSFNAFNEGTRLEHCVKLAEKLFGEKITKLGGDCSYSGNDNRSFCSEKGIVTSFAQKGKNREASTSVSMVKKELASVRATAMEGSFGTQKEHYGLQRINGRIKKTEVLIIFFGIHTANAVQLARRIANAELSRAA